MERQFVMIRRTDMRQLMTLSVVCLAVFSLAPVARADDDKCKNVNGHGVSTVIPAPNDPLGRTLGSSTGDLKAAVSGLLTSLTPQPDGSIQATSVEVWVLGPQDILIMNCKTTVTPIPGAPMGTVADSTTETVVGGTGKFVGASGTLKVTGTGFNVFGPQAGPGSTYFDTRYEGNICRSK
jgi:hypothetical protein